MSTMVAGAATNAGLKCEHYYNICQDRCKMAQITQDLDKCCKICQDKSYRAQTFQLV